MQIAKLFELDLVCDCLFRKGENNHQLQSLSSHFTDPLQLQVDGLSNRLPEDKVSWKKELML